MLKINKHKKQSGECIFLKAMVMQILLDFYLCSNLFWEKGKCGAVADKLLEKGRAKISCILYGLQLIYLLKFLPNRQIQGLFLFFLKEKLIGSSNYFLARTWGFARVACGMRVSFFLTSDSDIYKI